MGFILTALISIVGPGAQIVPDGDKDFEAVRLLGYADGKGGFEIYCSGVFISDKYLITAAHCVPPLYRNPLGEIFDIKTKTKSIKSYSYDQTEFVAEQLDFALVEFPAKTFTGQAFPINFELIKVGDTLKLAGFGKNNLDPKTEIDFKKRSADFKITEANSTNLFSASKTFIYDSDSGAPLLKFVSNQGWTVVGIAEGSSSEIPIAEDERVGLSTFVRLQDLKTVDGHPPKKDFIEQILSQP